MVVIVLPDVLREDSFVLGNRLCAGCGYADHPALKLPGTILPITINLLTWIPFADYKLGIQQLLARLRGEAGVIDTSTPTLVAQTYA